MEMNADSVDITPLKENMREEGLILLTKEVRFI